MRSICIAVACFFVPNILAIRAGDSPFDALDATDIPDDERFEGMPEEIVAVLPDNRGLIGCISLSPDGRWLAFGDDNRIRLVRADALDEASTLRGHKTMVLSLAFSRDGMFLFSSDDDGALKMWNLQGDRPAELDVDTLKDSGGAFDMVVSADGTSLFTASGESPGSGKRRGIAKWDLTQGAPVEVRRFGEDPNLAGIVVAVSDDGHLMAMLGVDTDHYSFVRLALWDVDSGERLMRFDELGLPNDVALSPDGRRLISSDGGMFRRSRLLLWDLERAEGPAQSMELRGHDYWAVPFTRFAPDGEAIISAGIDGRVIIWDAESGEKRRVISFGFSHSQTASSADCRYLATAYRGGPVYIVRLFDDAVGD